MDNTNLVYEKEELYYYTSLSTLQTILQKKTARLTDYRFLNDRQEVVFAMQQLKNCLLKNNTNEKTLEILNAVQNMENGRAQNLVFRNLDEENPIIDPIMCDVIYYVMSLSHSRDDLMMWRMYAQEGCCLKFNSQKLFEYFDSFRDNNISKGLLNIIRGNVSYGEDPNINFQVSLLSNPYFELMIYYHIMHYCLLRKNQTFSSEHEYRIAIPFTDSYLDKSCSREDIIQGTMIKPQIELKNFPIEDIIEEVIISPFIKTDTTHLGIQEMLKAHNISPDIVKKSDISIR